MEFLVRRSVKVDERSCFVFSIVVLFFIEELCFLGMFRCQIFMGLFFLGYQFRLGICGQGFFLQGIRIFVVSNFGKILKLRREVRVKYKFQISEDLFGSEFEVWRCLDCLWWWGVIWRGRYVEDRSLDKKGGGLRRYFRMVMSFLRGIISYNLFWIVRLLFLKFQCNFVLQRNFSCLLGIVCGFVLGFRWSRKRKNNVNFF